MALSEKISENIEVRVIDTHIYFTKRHRIKYVWGMVTSGPNENLKAMIFGNIGNLQKDQILKFNEYKKSDNDGGFKESIIYVALSKPKDAPSAPQPISNSQSVPTDPNMEKRLEDEKNSIEVWAGADKGYLRIFNIQEVDQYFNLGEYYKDGPEGLQKDVALLTKNNAYVLGGHYTEESNINKLKTLAQRLPSEVLPLFAKAPRGTFMNMVDGQPYGKHGDFYYLVFASYSSRYLVFEDRNIATYTYGDLKWDLNKHPTKPDSIAKIRIALNAIDYMTNEFRVPSSAVTVIEGEYPVERMMRINYYTVGRFNPELANVICTKSLNNVKKTFDGFMEIDIKVSTLSDRIVAKEIKSVSIDDTTFKRLKKVVRDRQLASELRDALKKARAAKDFYSREKLKSAMAEANKDLTMDEIEEAINRKFKVRAYDERYFNYLKAKSQNSGNDTIFMTEENHVFVVTNDVGTWRLVETPGKSAATYIFDDTIADINQFLALFESLEGLKGAFTMKNNMDEQDGIFDDNPDPLNNSRIEVKRQAAAFRRKIGFITRIIHTGMTSWQLQLEDIINNKDIIDPLFSDTKPVIVQRLKKLAQEKARIIDNNLKKAKSSDTPII